MTVKYSITLIDDYGRMTKRVYEAKQQTLLADQVTDLANFVNQYELVTDLGIIRADIIYVGMDEGFAVTAGANVDVGATFSGLSEDGNGAKVSLKLPGIKASKVAEDGTVPLDDADIEDWLELWLTDTPYTMLLSDGETVDSWLSGALDR
jgi:hypothetical protein